MVVDSSPLPPRIGVESREVLDAMDRPLSGRHRWSRRIRILVVLGIGAVAVVAVAVLVSMWFAPSVSRARLRTARVEAAPIEATVTANGLILPMHQQVLTSPGDSRVLRILKVPGDQVEAGEPILELDDRDLRLDLDKLGDQIRLERNARDQARLDLEAKRNELQAQSAIKSVELEGATAELERHRKLSELGLATQAVVSEKEIAVERLRIEIERLGAALEQAEQRLDVQLAGLQLKIDVLEKEQKRGEQRLDQARTAPDRPGIVTWVFPDEGGAVYRGDELARVADLQSFKVEASLSDVHAATVAPGVTVRVDLGEDVIEGQITQVRPTVDAGVVTFEAGLQEPSHPLLRHNLRAEVHVVTGSKAHALVMPQGRRVVADGEEAVFVIKGDQAIRTPIRVGISNFDRLEVVQGLEPGDEVILSDMTDYTHLRTVQVK